ncbi:MAG: SdpI family protein [Bacillota bacterium]
MGFWIFMLIMDLLIPLIMIGFGSYFAKNAPKEINWLFGYRTTMSMKNKDTWEFAHRYSERIWRKVGWIMLPSSVIVMIASFGQDADTVGVFGTILCLAQLAVLIASIFPTEAALRRAFDENGRHRE